ncbi:MAG TPA: dephospho-CoA kinase [Candidatus Limosilactobacillus intestinipullorum]|nr:dephospho-CoA kinase [Candidatus Limosilactobacillus intestinipullorum]
MTKVVGLTGGIASGKSTVSKMLSQVGFPIVDADLVAHRLQQPGQPGFERLVDHFGRGILTGGGELDRSRLGQLAFGDPVARDELNQAMQPLIREEIMAQVANFKRTGVPVVVIDVPLLFEQHYDDDCDLTVVVTVDRAHQLQRLQQRNGYDRVTALARIDAQLPLTVKAARADIVIDNNGDYHQLQKQVAQLVKRLHQA